jgi:hypothetical protein
MRSISLYVEGGDTVVPSFYDLDVVESFSGWPREMEITVVVVIWDNYLIILSIAPFTVLFLQLHTLDAVKCWKFCVKWLHNNSVLEAGISAHLH